MVTALGMIEGRMRGKSTVYEDLDKTVKKLLELMFMYGYVQHSITAIADVERR